MIDNINATCPMNTLTGAMAKTTPAEDKRKARNHLVLQIIVDGVKQTQQEMLKEKADNKKHQQEDGCQPVGC